MGINYWVVSSIRFPPICGTGEEGLTWRSYFERIEKKLPELKGRDGVSLQEIAEITGEKAAAGNPFFDVIFNFTHFHVYDHLEKRIEKTGDGHRDFLSSNYESTNTWLDCTVNVTGNILNIKYFSGRQLRSGKTLSELHEYLNAVIGMLSRSRRCEIVDKNAVLPLPERRRLLEEFNATAVDYPRDKTMVELFEEQAGRTPERIAVVCGEGRLTYRELDERSNQLGHYLHGRGVEAETLVPVCLERSLELIIGMLGILKAGGAYVPIDPAYPAERIGYMLEDTGARLVLSSASCRDRLPGTDAIELDDWSEIGREPVSRLAVERRPDQLAYVTYTSGSTGRPKGVMIEHASLLNFLLG